MEDRYEQMEFDVTLESEKELKENIRLAIGFASKQIETEGLKPVVSRHEGYGVVAERHVALTASVKAVSKDMADFLAILPASDREAIDAAARLQNSATEVAYQAILLAAQAGRVSNDIYKLQPEEITPLEQMMGDTDGFEETEAAEGAGDETEE